MRIPVIPDDPDSPGTILKKFVFENMSPGQVRIHCYPATASQLAYFKFAGKPNAMYSPGQPLGKNSINDRFKKAGVIMGLSKPLHGHSLRRLAITKMVCGGVSITEVMSAARHTSVSATTAYIQRNQSSNLTKLQALGIDVPLKSD
jgi:integrase